MGTGDQRVSWIHVEDLVRAYDFILHHPTWFTIPSWIVKALFGEGSSVMLESKTVASRILDEAGFVFTYPTFEEAFLAIVK